MKNTANIVLLFILIMLACTMSTQPLTLTIKALRAFSDALKAKKPIKMDDTLHTLWEKNATDARTRRIVYARTMDVIRRFAWADTLIQSMLSRPCPPDMHYALMIGAVELFYPPRPAQLTINHITNWAKKSNPKFGTMVYGVLKKLQRDIHTITNNHCPVWLIDHLIYPENILTDITTSWMQPPMLFIRIHPWNIQPQAFEDALNAHNISHQPTTLGWIITQAIAIHDIPGYTEGWFYVQDHNAAYIDIWLQSIHGTLWDACAAPGGKTLSALAYNELTVTASDVSAKRLAILHENIARARPPQPPFIHVLDAKLPHASQTTWDAILLDVPCSGSGQFHKNPERKWLLTQDQLTELQKTQALLLHNTWQQLKPGGELLYMTCSVFACENTHQIEHFLKNNTNASSLELTLDGHKDAHGITLLPHTTGGGFYLARLKKAL